MSQHHQLSNTGRVRETARGTRVAGSCIRASVLRAFVAALAVLLALGVAPAKADFDRDLQALTAAQHRLSGSPEGRAAADYIEGRLRSAGLEVFPLDMVVWQTRVVRCEMVVGGKTVPMLPLQPNLVVPPVTPRYGLTAPSMWVGDGSILAYGSRTPETIAEDGTRSSKVVVLDYDSFDNWETAFALGAEAVVFVGKGEATPVQPKAVGVPANLLRFYVKQEDLAAAGVDLTQDHESVTLHSEVVWEKRLGRNLVARVKGTEPGFAGSGAEEAVVLATNFDSFGVVPQLSPGARGAANVAAMIEAAEAMAKSPAKRHAYFMFLDNQARLHQGAREVYAALTMTHGDSARLIGEREDERGFIEGLRQTLSDEGLVARSLALEERLKLAAEHLRDDTGKKLQIQRLALARATEGGAEATRLQAEVDELVARQMRWDDIRRSLHKQEVRLFIALQDAIADRSFEAPAAISVDPKFAPRFKEEVERFQALEPEAQALAAAQAGAYRRQLGELRDRTMSQFDARLAELRDLLAIDAQRAALRDALVGPEGSRAPVISLHASYDLSGDAATWGVVVGDWTDKLFKVRTPKPEGNQPGHHGPTLGAFARVIDGIPGLKVDTASLKDPTISAQLSPRPFVSSGYVAGMNGFYHVTFMTAYDARLRDGHPADTVQRLNVPALRQQAAEATRVMQALASHPELSRPQVFKSFARSKYPTFSGGRTSGEYAGEMVTGSLSENRPATGALLALWPGRRGSPQPLNAWDTFRDAMQIASFQPLALEAVDANGRWRVLSMEETMNGDMMTLGALFDERGEVRAISTRKNQAQQLTANMRVDLFAAQGFVLSTIETYALKPEQLKILRSVADAEFRETRILAGQADGVSFWYISDYYPDDRVKIFQPMGPVALGAQDEETPAGAGLPQNVFLLPTRPSDNTADSLWLLNEGRLSQLRSRGVTPADLEDLHNEAKRQAEIATVQADAGAAAALPVAAREAALQRASMLSHRVYAPLRTAMDDLVHAIVMLLLLAIPFAFALERLLICSPTIYGRIAGFVAIFLVTFTILYFTHPGFAIASTPVIIFLAFTIILLSSLVIYIVVRKFRTELRAMQGLGTIHESEVSQTGTLLAAVNMGMSTMRRRPTRTGLTAITVVALTFTILCFASFTRTIGVRSIPAGLKSETTAAGLLLRNLDYSAMPQGILTMLQGTAGQGGLVAAQWWLVRTTSDIPAFSITDPQVESASSQYSVPVDAVMGVALDELDRWYDLAVALGAPAMPEDVANDRAKREAFVREHVPPIKEKLAAGGVFLPPIVQDMLGLEPGQPILIRGQPATFAGVLDTAQLQRLRHLDGQSVIPVDFQAAGAEGQGGAAANQPASEQELVLADDVEKDFVHLSADQVAVVSTETTRRLGGNLHLIAVYPGTAADGSEILPDQLGRDLAKIVVMPVWAAGQEGVERMLLTVLTEVSGGLALGVPLVLGGLIIFGTLLGSISDREKEIYTFSALGLSPTHVGVLFFAEAAVYAVVGGMGGQLLAQFVALGASALARAGYIDPANINYSSTNALFAIGVVMATVIVSAIYPALRASKSANPGLARAWKMPPPVDDDLRMKFPFTVSAYDITGVVSYLAEHFRRHDDAGLGSFAAENVRIRKTREGNLELSADLALAPFDLGVTQHLTLTATPSEIEGVDEVAIHAQRKSGAKGDWLRSNQTFLKDLRRQFLLWRTLSSEMIERYRMETLTTLGEAPEIGGPGAKTRTIDIDDNPDNPTGVHRGPSPMPA